MNHRGQILRSSRRPLWECILDRHKYRGRSLRPRVPLVFRRVSSPENFYQRPRSLTPVVQYPLNLRLQLSWPLLTVKETRLRETIRQSSVIRTYLQRTFERFGHVTERLGQTTKRFGHTTERFGHTTERFGRTTETSFRTRPADVQFSSLINSYAIVNEQRNQLHTALNVFKSAARVPLPLLPVTLAENPRSSTDVEVNAPPKTFPQIVITNPLITGGRFPSVREMVTRHHTHTTSERQTVRGRETVGRAEVIQSSRVHTDTSSPPIVVSGTTRYSPATKTETTRASFVPPQQRPYWQPAARDFVTTPSHPVENQPAPQEPQSLPQRASVPQPALDIGQLSEEVYRHIQRKLRIERERRGL